MFVVDCANRDSNYRITSFQLRREKQTENEHKQTECKNKHSFIIEQNYFTYCETDNRQFFFLHRLIHTHVRVEIKIKQFHSGLHYVCVCMHNKGVCLHATEIRFYFQSYKILYRIMPERCNDRESASRTQLLIEFNPFISFEFTKSV